MDSAIHSACDLPIAGSSSCHTWKLDSGSISQRADPTFQPWLLIQAETAASIPAAGCGVPNAEWVISPLGAVDGRGGRLVEHIADTTKKVGDAPRLVQDFQPGM